MLLKSSEVEKNPRIGLMWMFYGELEKTRFEVYKHVKSSLQSEPQALGSSEAHTEVYPAETPEVVPAGRVGRDRRTPRSREGQQATTSPRNCPGLSHIPSLTLGIIPDGHTHNPIKQPVYVNRNDKTCGYKFKDTAPPTLPHPTSWAFPRCTGYTGPCQAILPTLAIPVWVGSHSLTLDCVPPKHPSVNPPCHHCYDRNQSAGYCRDKKRGGGRLELTVSNGPDAGPRAGNKMVGRRSNRPDLPKLGCVSLGLQLL